jgi:hypothetical protein
MSFYFKRTSALWHLPTLKLPMQMETPDTPPVPNLPQMAGCQQEPCSPSSVQEPEQQECGTTNYAECACHEKVWENKWKCAVEMAARAEMERDELRAIIYEVSTGGYTPMAAYEWLKSHPENSVISLAIFYRLRVILAIYLFRKVSNSLGAKLLRQK